MSLSQLRPAHSGSGSPLRSLNILHRSCASIVPRVAVRFVNSGEQGIIAKPLIDAGGRPVHVLYLEDAERIRFRILGKIFVATAGNFPL